MNNTRFYFGAYAEVKTKPVPTTKRVYMCGNGHEWPGKDIKFCSTCGEEVSPKPRVGKRPAMWLSDLTDGDYTTALLETVYEDVLRVMVSYETRGDGFLKLKPNQRFDDRMVWLEINDRHFDSKPIPFPTPAEVREMIDVFQTAYSDVLAAVEASKYVESVVVKAGFVVDAEI